MTYLRKSILALGIVTALGVSARAGTAAGTPAANLGMNLDQIDYWNSEGAFADLATLLSSWGTPGSFWVADSSLQFDANGYPTSSASAAMSFFGYSTGDYTVSWSGSGSVQFLNGGTPYTLSNQTTVNGVTTATLDIATIPSMLDVTVNPTSASNPIQNLHIYAPGSSATTGEYTQQFINQLQPFSVIRTMQWTNTNGTNEANWSDRVSPTYYSQAAAGQASWESVINLANQADKNIWVNIPDQATPAYVTSMADLFAKDLNPNLHVYLEFSNEVWNSAYQQSTRQLAAAQANPVLTATDEYTRLDQQVAYEIYQDSTIWKQQFGARSSEVLPVLTVQWCNPYGLQQGLQFLQDTYGDPSKYISYIAVAPYVSLDPSVNVPGMTLDQLFANLNLVINRDITSWLAGDAAVSSQFNVPLISYEGGQSLIPMSQSTNATVMAEAQNDPRMAQVYAHLLQVWQQEVGNNNLFTVYSYATQPNNFGAWGALQNGTDPGSVKWDELLRLMLPAGDATLDPSGKVTYADFQILQQNFGKSGTFWEQGNFLDDPTVDAADFNAMAPNLTGLTAAEVAQISAFATSIGTTFDYSGTTLGDPAPVPEPTCLGILALGGLLLGRPARSTSSGQARRAA